MAVVVLFDGSDVCFFDSLGIDYDAGGGDGKSLFIVMMMIDDDEIMAVWRC
jgi:hypothetical protein